MVNFKSAADAKRRFQAIRDEIGVDGSVKQGEALYAELMEMFAGHRSFAEKTAPGVVAIRVAMNAYGKDAEFRFVYPDGTEDDISFYKAADAFKR